MSQFEEQVVGGKIHRELWIPAEELEMFNQQIIGKIEVLATFYGEQFSGDKEW